MKKFAIRFFALCAIASVVGLFNSDEASARQRRSSGDTINRSVGLGAYMQFGHLEVIVPVWVSQQLAVVPIIGLTNTENVGSQVGVGAVLRIYQKIARVSPYFGVRAHADVTLPNGGGSTTDLQGGILYGGEFFLNNQFSFGIEAHVVVFIPDVGPRVISTATMFMANLYF